MVLMTLLVAYHHSRSTTPSKRWRVVDGACSSKFRVHARKNSLPRTDCFGPVDYRIRANPVRPISFRHLAGSDRVGYLACRRPSNFRDFTWSKFSGHNLRSLVLKDQKPFLSLTGRVPLANGSIPPESTVRASKGQALQLAHGLDFLSIQAYRLWMEYPSRETDENYGPKKPQPSQLIAVGRGGCDRGDGNRHNSHRRLEQTTVEGAVFKQGADRGIDADNGRAAIE